MASPRNSLISPCDARSVMTVLFQSLNDVVGLLCAVNVMMKMPGRELQKDMSGEHRVAEGAALTHVFDWR